MLAWNEITKLRLLRSVGLPVEPFVSTPIGVLQSSFGYTFRRNGQVAVTRSGRLGQRWSGAGDSFRSAAVSGPSALGAL
jgi:hypothetical protein